MSKKTIEQIVKSGNNYVVKVKRNQKRLLKEMEQIQQSSQCIDKCVTKEINRGRKEIRAIQTFRVSALIKDDWLAAKTVVHVKRERETKTGKSQTDSYYLSSISVQAKDFAKGIRHHWGIENRLHYVKDVTLKEDESKIRSGNAPGILSLIKNLVINTARINGENSIKKFTRQCTGNVLLIASLLE